MHFTTYFALGFAANTLASPLALIQKRDAATISGALDSVKASVDKLDTAIKAVPAMGADATTLGAVAAMSSAVGDTIKSAMAKVQATDAVDLKGAASLESSAAALGDSVTAVNNDLVAKRAPIKAIGASALVGMMLQMQKQGSAAFTQAVTSKLPAIAQKVAGGDADKINQSFDDAIKAFMQDGGAAPPAA